MDLNSIMPMRRETVQARFTCKYCHRTFVSEDKYLAHECKQMKRDAELKSPQGQAALGYYQTWMRQLKRLPPPAQSFATSKYFRTFMNFTKFVKDVDLPMPDKFIWYMVQKTFSPTMWMNDEVYSMYLEFLDRKIPPLEQVKLSVNTLLNYSDRRNFDVSDFFDHVEAYEVMHMIRVRKLSPWLLLTSSKFKQFYVNRANEEQRMIIESLIRPSYWADKFDENPDAVGQVKQIVAELGI